MTFPIQAGIELRRFPLLPAHDAELVLLSAFARLTNGQGPFFSWNVPLAVRSGAGRYQPILSTSLVTAICLALIGLALRRRVAA